MAFHFTLTSVLKTIIKTFIWLIDADQNRAPTSWQIAIGVTVRATSYRRNRLFGGVKLNQASEQKRNQHAMKPAHLCNDIFGMREFGFIQEAPFVLQPENFIDCW